VRCRYRMGQYDRTALVTGASTALGAELVRHLGAGGEYKRIYLGCHCPEPSQEFVQALHQTLDPSLVRLVSLDTGNSVSMRRVLTQLDTPLDDVFLHADCSHAMAPMELTRDGVTHLFASNVLGHVILLEGLIDRGLLKRSAVLSGSEAARGVPMLGIPAPRLRSSSVREFASLCDGSYFDHHPLDLRLAYAHVKYVGAMWMAALSRRHPRFKLLTISPGNTRRSSKRCMSPI
jgi:NAD(P)-dependent dehydrogenase (short-subunit alcohol dehydrogenase family)